MNVNILFLAAEVFAAGKKLLFVFDMKVDKKVINTM